MTDDTERAAWLAGLRKGDKICVTYHGNVSDSEVLSVGPKTISVKHRYYGPRGMRADKVNGLGSCGRIIPPTDAESYRNKMRRKGEIDSLARKLYDLTDDQLERIASIVNEGNP